MKGPTEFPASAVPVQFYATAPYPCSYLPDRQARSQVATPGHLVNTTTYSALVAAGFRRSGTFTYRPYCDGCRACVPVRIPVNEFKGNRTQRKTWRRHAHLRAYVGPLRWQDEHYALYQRYQSRRHPGGGMDQDDREQYAQFLLTSAVDTQLVAFRDTNEELVMVSIVDVLDQGLSAVYTFYDPDYPGSLGTWGILWLVEQCRALQLPWLYLGYWIRESPKMAYKTAFQPLEGLIHGRWQKLALQR